MAGALVLACFFKVVGMSGTSATMLGCCGGFFALVVFFPLTFACLPEVPGHHTATISSIIQKKTFPSLPHPSPPFSDRDCFSAEFSGPFKMCYFQVVGSLTVPRRVPRNAWFVFAKLGCYLWFLSFLFLVPLFDFIH